MPVDPNEAPEGYIAVGCSALIDGICGLCVFNGHLANCAQLHCDAALRADREDVYFVKKPAGPQKPTCDGRAIVAMMCRDIRSWRHEANEARACGDGSRWDRLSLRVKHLEILKDRAKAMLK